MNLRQIEEFRQKKKQEKANELASGNAEIEHHLGLNYEKLGQTDLARSFLASAAANESYARREEAANALKLLEDRS